MIRDEKEIADREDIINMSLLITPSSDALGNWEKYTKVHANIKFKFYSFEGYFNFNIFQITYLSTKY